jgi:hypothetical protein
MVRKAVTEGLQEVHGEFTDGVFSDEGHARDLSLRSRRNEIRSIGSSGASPNAGDGGWRPSLREATVTWPSFDQLSTRVSFLAISPFSKQRYVSRPVGDHTSILAFIEK